ncbi:restriction endonuclease [Achromobacter mucicolens]|uniref:Type I restriction modification DNA specificity domain-containing protein n=1 Tax=Achromobacter mucicolens TaxID=1389922 RepID=A0ABM8LHZ0_9BURK|nr:restriction endonuclease [Achromobacter mucicolens]CAB3896173.1 hypothetical protein LMG3415_04224 [Achromobacter mucicolens]
MPKVSELFDLQYGHSLELNALEKSSHDSSVNFVGRAARNNGVTARVAPILGVAPAAAGTLTVALGGQGGAGVAFVQPSPFYCGRDVMVLTPKKPMTEMQKLWWATCITANRFRFGFGRQANRTLKDLQLPSQAQQPKWVETVDFTEAFTAELHSLAGRSSEARGGSPLDIGNTHCKVSDLFDVQYGTNLELVRLKKNPRGVNFVSRTAKNNGVTAKVDELADLLPTAGRTLSVAAGGSVLETFVQFEPFYTGRDMYVLKPKVPMTDEELIFYASCVRANQWRYSYGRQANRTLRNLRIPAMSSIPTWVYGSFRRVANSLAQPLK